MINYEVIIIGGGPAGISAAIWAKRLGIRALLLEKENQLGGQLHYIKNPIIDYPGLFHVTGEELLQHMERHLQALHCDYRTNAEISSLDVEHRIARVKKQSIQYRYLIWTAGASERYLHIPGERELLHRGEVYSTSTQGEYFKEKDVLIVGGGDRAFEGAYRVADAARSVRIVHRSNRFKARAEFMEPVKRHPKVAIYPFCTLEEIVWKDSQKWAVIQGSGQNERYEWNADIILIRIGVEPSSSILKNIVHTNSGYIVTDERGRTSRQEIFAAGDVVHLPEYSSISHSIGSAMVAVKSISLEMGKADQQA